MPWHIQAKTNLRMNESGTALSPAANLQSVVASTPTSFSLARENRRKQKSSLSELVRNVKRALPGRKHEQGQTLHDEECRALVEATVEDRVLQRKYRRSSINLRGIDTDAGTSDRIEPWNFARDVPDSGVYSRQPRRAVSAMTYQDSNKYLGVPGSPHARIHTAKEGQISLIQNTTPQDWRSPERRAESRRLRRSLKESGDYLGVQGINPQTGQLDVLSTSESEQSSNSHVAVHSSAKSGASRQEPKSDNLTVTRTVAELKRERQREHQKLLSRVVYWKRQAKQWSSVGVAGFSSAPQSNRRRKPVSRSIRQLDRNTSPRSRQGYHNVGPGTPWVKGRRSAAHSPDNKRAEDPIKIPGSYPADWGTEDGIGNIFNGIIVQLWQEVNSVLCCGTTAALGTLQVAGWVMRSGRAYWDFVLRVVYMSGKGESRLRDVISMVIFLPLILVALMCSLLVIEVVGYVSRRSNL